MCRSPSAVAWRQLRPHARAPCVRRWCSPSSIGRIERKRLGDLALPPVAIQQQALLIIVELFPRLAGKFEVRALDDGVNGARFLAQAAIDALVHVEIVARGAPCSVDLPGTGLDGDALGRTNGLAKFASNAPFLTVGIASQRVLAAKARTERSLFERIVERSLRFEKIAQRQRHRADELHKQRGAQSAITPSARAAPVAKVLPTIQRH